MDPSMYTPYPGSSPGPYRPGSNETSGKGPPQGSKLATYMSRGGSSGGPYHNVTDKMNNLTLDQATKKTPGTLPPFSIPAPTGVNSTMYSGQPPYTNSPFHRPPTDTRFPPPGLPNLGPPAPGHGHLTEPERSSNNMDSSKQLESQAITALLREIEKRAAAQPKHIGQLSPTLRNLGPPMNPAVVHSSPPTSGPGPTSEQEGCRTESGPQVSVFSENGTTYFYNPDESLSSQLSTGVVTGGSVLVPNWSAYSGTPSQVVNMKVRASAPKAVRNNEIKMDILTRHAICHANADPETHPDLPTEVDNFTSLCPIEPPSMSQMHKSSTFGYLTTVYKSINVKTGQFMCLRRIHGYRLVNTKCMSLVDQWKKMAHSNIVALRQVFTSKSFGDHSMVFVYDYYPAAETLMSKHFSSTNVAGNPLLDPTKGEGSTGRSYTQRKNNLFKQQALHNTGLLPESVIWNYIIQLTSALRCIHGAGLACRTLDPTKILVINKTRVLLNCVGIFDVLTFDPNSTDPVAAMTIYQQEDLVSLGRIALALACNSFMAIQGENLMSSMDVVTSTYSSDLRNLIIYLLTSPQRAKSVNDLMPMIGARFYTALDSGQQRNDALEVELARDVESFRLFRLLCKLNTVVDRAEFHLDASWAETGDRYMLKLFRDYLFHQVMEDGRPFLDMAHIVANLNKLDSGIRDKVCLMSRDQQNVLVVSYSELKSCLEQSYGEILGAATGAKPKNIDRQQKSLPRH